MTQQRRLAGFAMPVALVAISSILALQITAVVLVGRAMVNIPDLPVDADAGEQAVAQYLGLRFSLAIGVVIIGMPFVVVLGGLTAARLLAARILAAVFAAMSVVGAPVFLVLLSPEEADRQRAALVTVTVAELIMAFVAIVLVALVPLRRLRESR